MIKKDIRFSGLDNATSDYDAPDGALQLSANIIYHDNALRPIAAPSTVMTLDGDFDWRVLAVFRPQAWSDGDPRHYIVLNQSNRSLACVHHGDSFSHNYFTSFPTSTIVRSAVIVGNTLVVLTSDGIYYYLWDNSNFKMLGSSLPDIPIGFWLKGHCSISAYSSPLNYPSGAQNTPTASDFDDNTRISVSNTVMAAVNKFVADNSTNAGRFIFPFKIRYALRLYDGTLTRHSAPVLMRPALGNNPLAFTQTDSQLHPGSNCYVLGVSTQLCYDILGNLASLRSDLNRWRDIVKSIDIFISAPLFTYDQSGDVRRFAAPADIVLPVSTCAPDSGSDTARCFRPCSDIYDDNYTLDSGRLYFKLPAFDDQQIADRLHSAPLYLLKSIPIDTLIDSDNLQPSHDIEIPDDYLPAIVAREVMTDDFNSRDTIIADYAFSYNQRLNLANLSRRILPTPDIRTFAQLIDGSPAYYARAYLYIRRDGRNTILRSPEVLIGNDFSIPYIFHHCADLYRILIVRRHYSSNPDTTPLEWCDISLSPDDFLNGASYLAGIDDSRLHFNSSASSPSGGIPADDDIDPYAVADLSNRIFLSDVNNPFFFSPSAICSVGTGKILAISSAARPLSEGQFGQFPLYAFTSEGIWALEVSAQGAYSARQPIARDIVLSSDSVTQIDSAVLFASSQGIMMISGSQVRCISDPLKSDWPLDLSSLPGFDKLSDIQPIPFSLFLADVRIIYDYSGSRIIAFNPAYNYAYLYSLKSHAWGMCYSDMLQNVPCYPEAMALDHASQLISFSDISVDSAILAPAVILTRPLKLDAPDILKTIDSIIQRGNFRNPHVNSVLYGSRDLNIWSLIWSSKSSHLRGFSGTPYKYFRIALLCNFDPDESISGASIMFRQRFTNHLR